MTLSPQHKQYTRMDLARIATRAMLERDLEPEFPVKALLQLKSLSGPSAESTSDIVDLTHLLWCSLDNDDSRDLDQLTVCTQEKDGNTLILVAVADVDALIKQDCPIDLHARKNTASVYTCAKVFPMLPERLSTDWTSLNPNENRIALVTEMRISSAGVITSTRIFRAKVRNKAKLAYDSVSAWIEGKGDMPAGIASVPGLAQQIEAQDRVAQMLRSKRFEAGALQFENFQPKAIFQGDLVIKIEQQAQNRARQLIEEFMIATNKSIADFLTVQGLPTLKRVVRSPDRWASIVELAQTYGEALPTEPDHLALASFLTKRKAADPLRFPDLSLVIVKLMGAGEYVVEQAGAKPLGHFGLAVNHYTHSTAPNRRYPDLITLRMVKNALAKLPCPYSHSALQYLAQHCSAQEDAVRKVERRVRKSEAALFLNPYIGNTFDGVITGVADHHTWVRIFSPPAEGMLMSRFDLGAIGKKVKVLLDSTDVDLGYINFKLAKT